MTATLVMNCTSMPSPSGVDSTGPADSRFLLRQSPVGVLGCPGPQERQDTWLTGTPGSPGRPRSPEEDQLRSGDHADDDDDDAHRLRRQATARPSSDQAPGCGSDSDQEHGQPGDG